MGGVTVNEAGAAAATASSTAASAPAAAAESLDADMVMVTHEHSQDGAIDDAAASILLLSMSTLFPCVATAGASGATSTPPEAAASASVAAATSALFHAVALAATDSVPTTLVTSALAAVSVYKTPPTRRLRALPLTTTTTTTPAPATSTFDSSSPPHSSSAPTGHLTNLIPTAHIVTSSGCTIKGCEPVSKPNPSSVLLPRTAATQASGIWSPYLQGQQVSASSPHTSIQAQSVLRQPSYCIAALLATNAAAAAVAATAAVEKLAAAAEEEAQVAANLSAEHATSEGLFPDQDDFMQDMLNNVSISTGDLSALPLHNQSAPSLHEVMSPPRALRDGLHMLD